MHRKTRITAVLTAMTIHAMGSDDSAAEDAVSAANAAGTIARLSSSAVKNAPIFLNVNFRLHKGGGFVSIENPFFFYRESSARINI